MSPLIFLNGVIFASTVSITIGLLITLLLVLVLGKEYPRLGAELHDLLAITGLFAVMTAFSAASFLSLIKEKPWRWLAQAAMWLGLTGLAFYFWPA